ncbi:RING-H2 finger protein [Melia azedarach]|uniref:RING-H2 finger protein n=2 Tax=Melia azedarach TaxID=155640 RepID=A0ACC1XVE0_MELAZ|nr:RING-H2 finger protein [Melia azedarach]KAJ4715397.1 RING-H2 finger protein [Melia azedarach]
MTSTSSSSSTQLFQDFLGKFHSRKLLIHNPLNQQPITDAPPPYNDEESSLDSNVVMILAVLICGVIFSVGLNFLIRCALSTSCRVVYSEASVNSSTPTVKRGIKKKALKTFPVVKYSAELKLPGLGTDCVICISELAAGERVRLLPKCNHGFHVRCIDKWLRTHSSCPTCRHCLIETCEKIMGCSQQASSSGAAITVPETVVSIRPLEPEGIIRNYGEAS